MQDLIGTTKKTRLCPNCRGLICFSRRDRHFCKKFCSRSCAMKYNRKSGIILGRKRHPDTFYEVKCPACGKPFTAKKRKRKRTCCSRECAWAMQLRDKVVTTCTVCKREFFVSAPLKKIVKYCSSKCRVSCRLSMEELTSIRGHRDRCERCGYKDHPEILQFHHRDTDRSHNTKENLE